MNRRKLLSSFSTLFSKRLCIGMLTVLTASCSVSGGDTSAGHAPLLEMERAASTHEMADPRSARTDAQPSTGTLNTRIALGPKAFLIDIKSPEYIGDATSYIGERVQRSKAGDSQASYEIHARVASCKRALDPGDDGEYKVYSSMGLAEQFSRRIEEEIENCKAIAERTDITGENWLSLAAAQGSIEARLMYAQNPRAAIGDLTDVLSDPSRLIDYRRNAVEYLSESVSSGNVDSIEALANIYDRGIVAERSYTKSLGYWMALQRVHPSQYSAESISRLSSSMQTEQIIRAQELSSDIYRSCCE
ncbi:MAG: hypothetical protein WCC51_04730 [Stenotrophomonas indicatrix]|uniref:hypothetical protein n=1 Tax=Stenotrophomonas indicatrix TaxID=2045451 RepID=UPI003C7C49C7